MNPFTPRAFLVAAAMSCGGLVPIVDAAVTTVERPAMHETNRHYVSNRPPLIPSAFIPLPSGSVEAQGWLREFLQRQRTGLTGHLGEISSWLQKEDNAWLSTDGKGRYGWEELPYWLKGYIELAYQFDDPAMIAECRIWIEGVLASQRPNGDFGPDQRFEDGTRDYWANMVMLFCLQTYYDHAQDARVLNLMTRYFHYQLTVPDDEMLTHYWQRMRGGDNLYGVHWLYNRTGDQTLLELAEKLHRCTANWTLPGDLPNWHNVNIAECFREPAQFYQQSHDPADLKASYANFREVRRRYGQVPGGMFGGDENSRPGFDDPHQAVETCGMVEQMLSDEMLMQISGDPFWADHCEEVAFNTYPAAVMPDFRALRYLTAPNMVVSDGENHAPGIQNGGPFLMMNPFSSRCCQHNHSHGWPYYAKSLWMATPDNGVCAALYSASRATVKVGSDGAEVRLTEETRYPFEDTVRITLATDQPVTFPLYLRIPSWCSAPDIAVNGAPVAAGGGTGKFVRIDRTWTDGDVVSLRLPMQLSVRRWTGNHDSVSVDYGPLTFSLKIGERYEQRSSVETAMGDSSWQADADPSEWPSYEIHPTTPWNYGLVLDPDHPEKSFTLRRGTWPDNNYPFTADNAPISLEVKARQIPEWTLDRHGLCAVLQDSPVRSDQPEETVTLIPMGCARLRISAFPVIGAGPDAHTWTAPQLPQKPLYRASASHVNDDVSAPCDGLAPERSADHTIPRFTWWDHRGTREWLQYTFEEPRDVSAVSVYWFDDTGIGQCRVPQSWQLLYRDGEEWKPVRIDADASYGARPDQANAISFAPVRTDAIRLDVQLQPEFSSGVLEWTLE